MNVDKIPIPKRLIGRDGKTPSELFFSVIGGANVEQIAFDYTLRHSRPIVLDNKSAGHAVPKHLDFTRARRPSLLGVNRPLKAYSVQSVLY